MDENKVPENSGELLGFDTEPETEELNDELKNGYTVTRDGGFYSGNTTEPTAADLLEEQFTAPIEPEEEVKADYFPSGNYGTPYNNAPVYTQPAPRREHYTPKKGQKPKKYSFGVVVLSAVLAAVIGALSGCIALVAAGGVLTADTSTIGASSEIIVESGDQVNINVENVDATVVEAVAEKVTDSVVGIRTTVSINNFFGGTQESSGEGSGVIYSADGYIITNYHVIESAITYNDAAIEVYLSGNMEEGHPATVVGYNISNDLAIIKINAKNLPAITLADSSGLKVGQFVVAIGNPGGLEFMGSVTYGVISGLNRIISDTSNSSTNLIQTDAAINPGNSGGALVNINGELIGINSSKIVSESYEGMGFAIPANTVKEICDKIIAKENDPTPYIGVTISERYDAETLKSYGYPVGAVVYSVAAGSPADEAGIESADIITEFNGVKITDYTVLGDAVADCTPGDTVSVTIYRARRYYSTNITVGSNNEVN